MFEEKLTTVKVGNTALQNRYSLGQKVYLFMCLLRTKLISKNIRIIRFPVDIRGKQYIDFGKNLTIGKYCRFEAYSTDGQKTLKFGENIQINDFVHISAIRHVSLGNNVLMAGKVYISDNSHGYYSGSENDSHPDICPVDREYNCRPVNIKDNVWIGESVTILPGVTIGKGSIIGANSVVSKNIPPFCIAAGVPAKPIKKYDVHKNWIKI